jgi:hypothetical protein
MRAQDMRNHSAVTAQPHPSNSIARRRRAPGARTSAFVAALLGAALPGCGGDDAALLGSYLDEIELNAPSESAASIPLGEFNIPSPTNVKRQGTDGAEHVVWMRTKFSLFAETLPKNESDVQAEAELHRGAINDAVLSIVRSASTDELTDPRLTALRMRLTETTRPLLGEDKLRQLVLYNHTTEPL